MSAQRFRKKPVEIEAMRFDGQIIRNHPIAAWIRGNGGRYTYTPSAGGEPQRFVIVTLEGEMAVSAGDYVIRGVQGEFYPCKPDIFEQTYDAVEGDNGPA